MLKFENETVCPVANPLGKARRPDSRQASTSGPPFFHRVYPGLESFIPSADDLIRFWDQVTILNGCWIWNGKRTKDGYGYFIFSGIKIFCHRLSFQLHKGRIPEGLSCLHSCDTPACVNPDHLRAGTQLDNVRDTISRGRKAVDRGSVRANSKLTESVVGECRELYAAGRLNQTKMSAQLGVSLPTLNHAVLKRSWAHV